MPQAEILRIIDVHGEQQPPSERRGDGASAEPVRREAMITWKIPVENVAVALRNPKPTIALEHAELPEVLDPRLVMLREPGSPQARNYRALRHRLMASPGVRVVAVTSARPGDGKTTCAANLALALAEDTMLRVLLVDANLPRPALGGLFGFTPSESLVDQIARFLDLYPPYPVASIGGTRMHVAALPDGPPQGRLERSLLGPALSELRRAYDYIVVDAAAVLESADADIVGECADAAILVARTGVSRKADLRRAVNQLAPALVLGTVLIDA
jgi:Mrp family chromosome partitioning ATPase